MINSEHKPNVDCQAGILPMQCYVQPFWKHSDIEIYNENNLDTMGRMPDNCIDLTVTSPPYDNLRDYKGYSFEFEEVAKELYRVTKPGGVVVWVVGDATVNGSETLTSFRQALFFNDVGFNVETMIYKKIAVAARGSKYLYEQSFEYMFLLSKGIIKTSNLLRDKRNAYYGCSTRPKKVNKDGSKTDEGLRMIPAFSKRHNVWEYGGGDKEDVGHPAVFPEQLAADHIQSWSNEGDIIYEPFGGSGTTAKMSFLLNRKCVMSEISKEYCELSVKRLSPYVSQSRLFR